MNIQEKIETVNPCYMWFLPTNHYGEHIEKVGRGVDKQCCQCGKYTYVPSPRIYTYKIKESRHVKYFCSYTCKRAYQKEKRENDPRRKKKQI